MLAMARLLKPGGRLVAVDMDMYATRAMPAGDAYDRFLQLTRKLEGAIGTDYAAGHTLPELCSAAGLTTTFLCADQPIYNSGPGKTLWENTWRVSLPNLIRAGVVAQAEGEAIIAEMAAHNRRPEVWIAVAEMLACVGLKP